MIIVKLEDDVELNASPVRIGENNQVEKLQETAIRSSDISGCTKRLHHRADNFKFSYSMTEDELRKIN